MATVVRKFKWDDEHGAEYEATLEFHTVSNYFVFDNGNGTRVCMYLDEMGAMLQMLKAMNHRIEVIGILHEAVE